MDWLTDPQSWIAFLALLSLEIVLGIDNIIFISILAGKLPAERQARARFLGLGLAMFIRIYCDHHHASMPRNEVQLHTHDVEEIAGKPVVLCDECRKLLTHAFVKRTHCPMDPKPMCKHCPSHCYHPAYRAKIREVMKFSGRKLLISGRVDYLLHLLF